MFQIIIGLGDELNHKIFGALIYKSQHCVLIMSGKVASDILN